MCFSQHCTGGSAEYWVIDLESVMGMDWICISLYLNGLLAGGSHEFPDGWGILPIPPEHLLRILPVGRPPSETVCMIPACSISWSGIALPVSTMLAKKEVISQHTAHWLYHLQQQLASAQGEMKGASVKARAVNWPQGCTPVDEVELRHLICPAPGPGLGQPVICALRQQVWEHRINDDGVQVLQVPDILRCGPPWHTKPFLNILLTAGGTWHPTLQSTLDADIPAGLQVSTALLGMHKCGRGIFSLQQSALETIHAMIGPGEQEGKCAPGAAQAGRGGHIQFSTLGM